MNHVTGLQGLARTGLFHYSFNFLALSLSLSLSGVFFLIQTRIWQLFSESGLGDKVEWDTGRTLGVKNGDLVMPCAATGRRWLLLGLAGALGPSFPRWNPGIHKTAAKLTQAM